MDGANGPDWDARGGRRYIARAVEASLRRLDTDHIDLYQIHRPDAAHPDRGDAVAHWTTWSRAGKVRYVGSSNFAGWQIADAAWTARTAHLTPFVSAQNEYSLLDRAVEADVVPACERFGVGLLPFFPLANGLLTGKYRRGTPPPAGTRLATPLWSGYLTDARVGRGSSSSRRTPRSGRSSLLDVAIGGLAAQARRSPR